MRVPLHQSLYGRVALAYAVLLPLLLAAQAVAVIVLVNRRDQANRVERPERARQTAAAALALSDHLAQSPNQPLAQLLNGLEPYGRLFAVMQSGEVVGARPPDRDEVQAFVAGFGTMREFDRVLPTEWSNGDFMAAPITAGPRLLGVVGIVPPTLFEQYGGTIILLGAILLLIGNLVLGVVIVGPVRARLLDLHQTAARLRDGTLSARATPKGRDELAEVALTFNEMATQLSARTEALEMSDRLRRQLVADVAHELMTPLTAVLGRLEGLCMDNLQLTADQRIDQAEHALHEARRLERLIGDLLASVRLETGSVQMTFAPVSVPALFDRVISRHAGESRSRHITIGESITVNQISADAFRLDQALDNLVVNALRHTPDGGRVRLSARQFADTVELTVWDSAGAIAPAHLPHIFDRFYKAASVSGIASPGSGLGLSIVKAIAERHGGSITATSSPQDGTTFTMVLPGQSPEDAIMEAVPQVSANL